MGELVFLNGGPFRISRHSPSGRMDCYYFPRAVTGSFEDALLHSTPEPAPLELIADAQGDVEELTLAYWVMNGTMPAPRPLFTHALDVDDAVQLFDRYRNRHGNLRRNALINMLGALVKACDTGEFPGMSGPDILQTIGAYRESRFSATIPPFSAYLGLELRSGDQTYVLDVAMQQTISVALDTHGRKRFMNTLPLQPG